MPDTFTPGDSCTVEVRLRPPNLARGGFQMSARFAGERAEAGRPAGSFETLATGTRVVAPAT